MIRMSAAAWQQIAAAARAAYPEECCGLLVGVGGGEGGGEVRVTRIVECENVAAPSRRDRFEIDPRRQFAVLRGLRGSAEAIVGHYHSHPDAAAAPSAQDCRQIFDPCLIWLIVAVDGEHCEAAAYRPQATAAAFTPVALVIGP